MAQSETGRSRLHNRRHPPDRHLSRGKLSERLVPLDSLRELHPR
jgi:hypothetical protein